MDMDLTESQRHLLSLPRDARIFLEGPAGTGKSSAAAARLAWLLGQGTPGGTVLLLVPQRTLAGPYDSALRLESAAAGSPVQALTAGGLAQRMVELFWPLAAGMVGFARPDLLPTFLTLETAQYYMAYLLRPHLEEGMFDSVTIDRNRLYSQVLDNLNKAAVAGFPFHQIGERLKAAWVGEPGQARVYEDVQTAAGLFRQFCLEHNLLDFSLQVEVFRDHLWPLAECRQYLENTYRHLVFDNLEEDTPFAHDLLRQWLPSFDSALLIYDHAAGYRRFLGADPQITYALKDLCNAQLVFDESLVMSVEMARLYAGLASVLDGGRRTAEGTPRTMDGGGPAAGYEARDAQAAAGARLPALVYTYTRFYPQMLDWVAEQIRQLVVEQGMQPGEIVVLAPFLSDALRFSLVERLAAVGIPARSHRPSRSLREEPATHCLLTLAALAYPDWGIRPSKFDVAYALVQAVQDMDLVRAQLLAEIVYRVRNGAPTLASFDGIRAEVQERITYRLGERYEQLRDWLAANGDADEAFDYFLSRMFGEVLSQPGFGFHASYDAGRVTANLVESVRKFRWVAGPALEEAGVPLGKEYLLMVQDGVIAAQYVASWQLEAQDAVLLAPAYTFLMTNRPVEAQFWLDVGSRGWAERLYQPLTHPYVLSRGWEPGRLWTDADEVAAGQDGLERLVLGLLRRCRRAVYLGLSELSEQGYEQRGPLLQALQRLLRNQPAAGSE